MQEGYIKLYRCILDSGWARHPDYMAVWIHCLLRGNYKAADVVTKWGGVVHLEPGQFITSREQISLNTGVQESKVERILKHFKSEQQIEQQNKGKFRIISILNWSKYQQSEQENEQQVNNTRTTGEQQVNTDKKVKKEKKEKKENIFVPPTPDEVGEYMLEIGYQGNAQQFHDYYSRNGWTVGKKKTKMKDWKGAVQTWRQNGYERSQKQSSPTAEDRLFDFMAGVKS